MNVTKSDLYKIIQALEDVRKYATMNTAQFNGWNSEPRLDIDNETLNKVIKSTTQLWRDSYIVTPLDETLETLKKYISL